MEVKDRETTDIEAKKAYYLFKDFEKGSKSIPTDWLLLMCNFGKDEFESFCSEVNSGNFDKPKNFDDYLMKYGHIFHYMHVNHGIVDLFGIKAFLSEKDRIKNFSYFYDIIEKDVDNLDNVKKLIQKIKDLGIKEIYYDEEFDFSKYEFLFNKHFWSPSDAHFAFLENIEVSPSFSKNEIQYHTTDSNYCIGLEYETLLKPKTISKFDRKIYLNSFSFSPDRLPDEITPASTIESIFDLADSKKEETESIYNSVYKNFLYEGFRNTYDILAKEISSDLSSPNREEELACLEEIKHSSSKLCDCLNREDDSLCQAHPRVTHHLLKKEKERYIAYRTEDYIDPH